MRWLLLLCCAWAAVGKETAPPGESVYVANCAFCHGPGARGGSHGGPDLAKSSILQRYEGTGDMLGAFLEVGRPARGMPAFHLADGQVKALAGYLHGVVEANSQRPELANKILVGDAVKGKAFFEGAGNCTQCHSVQTDLKGIGAKYSPVELQGRLVLPRGDGGYPQPGDAAPPDQRVVVTGPDGRTETGRLLFLSDYFVTFADAAGGRHTIERRGETPKVVVEDPLTAHLALQDRLTDGEMHDVTAYLASLK